MRIIVYDTETTGLLLHPHAPLSAQPRIIEFAAVALEDGEIVNGGSLLINPEQEISAEISKITGLTNEDLRDKPNFKDSLPKIRAAFKGSHRVMAHNLQFDKGMLFNELLRCGTDDAGIEWPPSEMCTVELYQELWGFRPRLIQLYADVMGKPLARTHRAMDDVMALVEIIQKEKLWKL